MAKLNTPSEYLSSLVGAGADLQSNLYFVKFYTPTKGEAFSDSASLTIRNTDITLPTFSQKTYPINYMTVGLNLPAPEIEGEKKIDMSFRIDANYSVYKFLKAWQAYTASSNGYAATMIPGEKGSASSEEGFTIEVYAMDCGVATPNQEAPTDSVADPLSNENSELLYKFENCWVESLSGLNYTYSSSEPLKASTSIRFYKLTTDPVSQALDSHKQESTAASSTASTEEEV